MRISAVQMSKIFGKSWKHESTALGECRSADFAEVNELYIRFFAVQMSKKFGKSRNQKVPLWENVDLLILLKSLINI